MANSLFSMQLVLSLVLCAFQNRAKDIKYPLPVLQTGETGIAYAMEFSADSKTLAAANGHRVTLWDRDRRWLVCELIGHTADVQAIAFAPAGKTLASASSNGELGVWNWDTGALIKMRRANDSSLFGVRYLSGGRIVTVGEDKAIRLWDDGGCEKSCLLGETPESPESLGVSMDGKWIAVGDTVNTVTVWRADLASLSATYYNKLTLPDSRSDGSDFIRGLIFDGRGRMAAVNFGGAIVLQDVDSWSTVFVQHTGLRLDGVVLDGGGTRIYAVGSESLQVGRTVAFNIGDGSRVDLSELPQYWTLNNLGAYRSIALSSDGKSLVAGGAVLLHWDLRGSSAPELFGESVRVTPGTIFSPNADSIMIPLQGVHMFSLLHGHFTTQPQSDAAGAIVTMPLGQTAVSADGRFLATPGTSRTYMRLFQEACAKVPPDQLGQCGQDFAARKSLPPTMALMVFRGSDLTFVAEFEMDEDPRPQFSESGDVLLWRTRAGLVAVDTRCMCNRRSLDVPLPDEGYFDLALDASASIVAVPKVGTNGRVVEVLALESGSVIDTLRLDGRDSVEQLTFNFGRSDKARALAVGTTSGSVYIWTPSAQGAERITGDSPVTSLAFSRNGNILAIGREDGSLSVRSMSTKTTALVSRAHSGRVTGVRFGFGNRWVASMSQDAVRFWSLPALTDLGTLIFPVKDGSFSWLFTTPQGVFEGEPRALGSLLWRVGPHLEEIDPVELFVGDYYRQGLMTDTLLGRSVKPPPSIQAKNRRIPTLSIALDVKDRAQTVKQSPVTGHIHIQRAVAPGGRAEPVRDLRLFRNGVLVRHWKGTIPAGVQDLDFESPIVPGVNEFTAYAFNADNIKSLDAEDGLVGDRSLAKQGVAYVLSVGVDDYSNGIPALHYSANDARAFTATISRLQAGRPVTAVTLTGADTTRVDILCGLKRLGSVAPPACASASLNRLHFAGPEDTVFLFFSGHGVSQPNGFALLPVDAALSKGRSNRGRLQNVISDQDLERELEPVLASQQVLVIDACGAGSLIMPGESANAPLNLNGFAQLAREKGLYILAGATSRQAAMEGPAQGPASRRSIMNYILLEEGIEQGKADVKRADHSLQIEEWFNYAVTHVPSAADQQPIQFLPMRQEDTRTEVMGHFPPHVPSLSGGAGRDADVRGGQRHGPGTLRRIKVQTIH